MYGPGVFQGGPGACGAGNLAGPFKTATTRNRPTLQHWHTNTSLLATRCMNARADSTACGLTAGIGKVWRATPSLSDVQANANTP